MIPTGKCPKCGKEFVIGINDEDILKFLAERLGYDIKKIKKL